MTLQQQESLFATPESPVSKIRRRVIETALAIEREDAKDAGMLAFMAWLFCQVGLPHSREWATREWVRSNGAVRLSVVAEPGVGLPYGRLARLILCYITTEAVRKREPRIELGRSISEFMARLNIGSATGGERGTLRYLRDQLRRLFTSTVSATLNYEDSQTHLWESSGFRMSDELSICWGKHADQPSLWTAYVDLSAPFLRMATQRAVPVDLRALQALRSPLAIDLLVWLSVRLSFLREEREIPWAVLELQFGANYSSTHEFRRKAIEQLAEVLRLYPSARLSVGKSGLVMKPSPPLVKVVEK